mmetsp:Transcript_20616/g.41254  ORF Transcript_20616/g.41254 Transcript_20616/m.41254 type:complete len:180 (-) Transcript_20616:328-867(-)
MRFASTGQPRSSSGENYRVVQIKVFFSYSRLPPLLIGVIFNIRITQKERYWEAVDNFQKKDGCSRVLAVRNMDAYFSDPSGWLVARDREKKYGEVTDYTKKTGVQKRPVFSLFWASFLFYFFFLFLPARMGELGGVTPSALQGGFCPPEVRVINEDGSQSFECKQTSDRSFKKFLSGRK